MSELSLREIQMESLKVLKVVKKICEKEGIQYSLAWGTLLGAVRHKGFIPWDDDVDVMMPRSEYERFISYCKNNADELKPFQIIHYSNNQQYVYVLARFSNSKFTVDYKNVRDYGLGTFVDIYPLDGLGNTYEEACKNMKKNRTLMHLIKLLNTDHFEPSPDGIAKTIMKYPVYLYAKANGLNNLISKFDKRCKSISYTDSLFVGIPTVETMESCIIQKKWIEEYTSIAFEDDTFPAPKMYDELLKHRYGNYMQLPPLEQQIAHHFYSVYKK